MRKTNELKRILRSVVIATVFFCQTVVAQQKIDETIDVTIVNVDVFVTDKKGNRVHGLGAEDFEIREDGKVQAITNFSEYGSATPTPAVSIVSPPGEPEQKAPVSPRARRNVILFIEPMSIPGFRAKELFDSIRRLLREIVGPGDLVAVTTWGSRLTVRQGFTDDIAAITRALDQLEASVNGVGGASGRKENEERADADRSYQEFLSSKGVERLDDTGALMGALAAATNQYLQIRQKTARLESLMQSISGMEGKKIILMATRRYGMFAGAEFFGGRVLKQYEQQLDTSKYRRSLIRTANAYGITLYPIHPEGLTWTPGDAGEDPPPAVMDNLILFNETAALQEVAAETGGLTAWGSKDIAAILPRVSDDLESYYSLGYRGRATGKDAARRIAVKAKNPEYVVRSRRQFVEKSDRTRMNDRVVASLFQSVEGSTISFDVSLGKIEKIGKNRWSVPIILHIPIAELTVLPRENEQSGEYSVFVAVGGAIGVMSDVEQRTQPFKFSTEKLEQAKASHFTYELTLTVDGGADRLSVGVFDEVGKEYGLQQLEIPKP